MKLLVEGTDGISTSGLFVETLRTMPHEITAANWRWRHETACVGLLNHQKGPRPLTPKPGNTDLIKQLREGSLHARFIDMSRFARTSGDTGEGSFEHVTLSIRDMDYYSR